MKRNFVIGIIYYFAPLPRVKLAESWQCTLLLLLSVLFTSTIEAQGKIKLRRPTAPSATTTGTAEASGQAEAEYTTSKGPEARSRTLYFGPLIGMNFSGVAQGMQSSPNANGWEFSPLIGLRSELYFKRVYGIIADLGYEQNRAYLTEVPIAGYAGQSILRTDYVFLRAMFSYRYSLSKVIGKVKFMRPIAEALKGFAGNLQAGVFAKTPLSAQLEILNGTVGDPNDPQYDVRSYTRPISGGFLAGLGFELRLASYIFFFEGQYFRGLLNSYNAIQSRYFTTGNLSEQGIYITMGIKTGVYGF